MSYIVDYHIHSYYSDGTMSPVDLVRKYKDEEYDIISITDHDGIGALKEASIAAEALKIKFVPGVELSTAYTFEGKSEDSEVKVPLTVGIHMLGYDFDPENRELNAKLDEMKQSRHERNVKLVQKLAEMGYAMDLAELEAQSKGAYVGKPNIARELVKRGYIQSFGEAFEAGRLLESPEINAIKREKISAEDAIRLISEAGGMAVIAHPAKIKGMGTRGSDVFWENMETIIRNLKKEGLKGVECYHPSHNEEERWRLFKIASKYHLHITEGSDFHGEETERK